MKQFFSKLDDLIFSDIFYVFPFFIKWLYHVHIKKDIEAFPLKNHSGKKATLYRHHNIDKAQNDKNKALFILHGMYGHPAVMQGFAEAGLESNIGPVFSFYVAYDEEDLSAHRSLIKMALDTIENIVKEEKGACEGIVLAGHSMGGIEAANTAFVEKDQRVKAVIALASRLQLSDGNDIHGPLEASIRNIYESIESMPDYPLFQILGEKDWCVPVDSLVPRKNNSAYIVKNGKHLNILFKKETLSKFREFLKFSVKSPRL